MLLQWFLFCYSISFEVLSSWYLHLWKHPYIEHTEKAKWRKVRERECFDWNLFLSSAAHYCIITRCSLFWKLEIVSWLFFLLLDNLSENNLVSKIKDLLKKIIDKKLTWKLERFGKCIKTSIYLGIILPRA